MSTSPVLRRASAVSVLALLFSLAAVPVSAGSGLSISTPFPAVSVAAGTKVSFDITVSAAANTRVALSVSGVPTGWTATMRGGGFVVDAVQTDAAGAAKTRLDVTVPGDATPSSNRITVTAAAGSQATLPLDITVSDAVAGAVTMTTATPTLQGAAGTTFTFTLTLHNDTAEDQTYAVTAQGPEGWTVNATLTGQAQAASAVVAAGATSSVTVAATPPNPIDAGDYTIQAVATVGEQTINADLGVRITGTNNVTLTTPDGTLSNRGSAGGTITQQLQIENNGTSDLTNLTITSTAPRDWTITYDPSDTIDTLAAGDTAAVTASIVPSGDAIAGDYVVTFTSASGQVSDQIEIRVTVETSPLWGFVGIALIVAVLAGLWWVFRTYGRR